MVNAQDFTYSKGYLGLLSNLGASLGIIFCCVPAVSKTYRLWREARERTIGHLLVDQETATSRFETPDEIPLPITEDNATRTQSRSAPRSINGCVADAKPPPYGGMKKHQTF